MTRRRIIAGVILLATMAVATVAYGPDVWRTVAYRDGWYYFHDSTVIREKGSELRSSHKHKAFVIRQKRLEWLPGPPGWVPDQVCLACLSGKQGHGHCSRTDAKGRTIRSKENHLYFGSTRSAYEVKGLPEPLRTIVIAAGSKGRFAQYPPDFRCTCTDPSHDGDSE